jgi:hypothetical protein
VSQLEQFFAVVGHILGLEIAQFQHQPVAWLPQGLKYQLGFLHQLLKYLLVRVVVLLQH